MSLKFGGGQKDEDRDVVLMRSGQPSIPMAGQCGKI